MKSNWTHCFLFCLVVISFFSCNKTNDVPASVEVYSTNAKLKRIYLYPFDAAKEPISIIDEYQYDDLGRISKVTHPFFKDGEVSDIVSYDVYEYNTAGQLIKIKKYNKNLTFGYINIENNIFVYNQTGNKEKEITEYPQINTSQYAIFSYSANNKLLETQKFDTNNKLSSYISNSYNVSGQLVKETFYGADGAILFYTLHTYSQGLLSLSVVYGGPQMGKVREVSRKYDNNNNLISVSSKELSPYSSLMDNTLKYEYYETGLVL